MMVDVGLLIVLFAFYLCVTFALQVYLGFIVLCFCCLWFFDLFEFPPIWVVGLLLSVVIVYGLLGLLELNCGYFVCCGLIIVLVY